MITKDYRLICDECKETVDFLTMHYGKGWCDGCIKQITLCFGTEQVGRYILFPDGSAEIYCWGRRPYWTDMVWEAQAKMGEHPLNVMFQLNEELEHKARQFLAKVNSG